MLVALCGACGKPARITGRVVDPFGVGISGVRVEITGTRFTSTTDATGAFELDYAPGHIVIHATSDHTSDANTTVDIAQLAPYPLADLHAVRFPRGTAPVAVSGARGEVSTPLREAYVESVTRDVGTIHYGVFGSVAPAIVRARELHVPANVPVVRGHSVFVFASPRGELVPALLHMVGPAVDGHCEIAPSVRMYGDRTARCPLGALVSAVWPAVGYATGPGGRVAISLLPSSSSDDYCVVYGRSDGGTPPRVSGVSDQAHCFRFEQAPER